MKFVRIALLSIAVGLSGCVVVPADYWYGGYHSGHYRYSGHHWDHGWSGGHRRWDRDWGRDGDWGWR
jgi:hypothetical protein